ncbi:hypothetical protein MMC28_010025, partial [Mycoblastus sanguinarius]|nr:hypothetical protein [Mycoblastus sanguinarius]
MKELHLLDIPSTFSPGYTPSYAVFMTEWQSESMKKLRDRQDFKRPRIKQLHPNHLLARKEIMEQ